MCWEVIYYKRNNEWEREIHTIDDTNIYRGGGMSVIRMHKREDDIYGDWGLERDARVKGGSVLFMHNINTSLYTQYVFFCIPKCLASVS